MTCTVKQSAEIHVVNNFNMAFFTALWCTLFSESVRRYAVTDRSQQQLQRSQIAAKTSKPHTRLDSQLEQDSLKPGQQFKLIPNVPNPQLMKIHFLFNRCGQIRFLSRDTEEDVTFLGMLHSFG